MEKWQNPLLTLGERAVAFAENEMNNGVKEDYPNAYTSERIREYFSACTRLVNKKEINIGFRVGNWCAAGASFCMEKSLLPGEKRPHLCRLGVVEVVSDLQKNGLWIPTKDVVSGKYKIKVGDLVVFDRSIPNKPETAWWRHIGRISEIFQNEFRCISGNNGGCWRISSHKLSQHNLLGFGQYPSIEAPVGVPMEGIDWSNANIIDLAPMEDTGNQLETSFYSIYNSVFKKD